MTEKGYSRDFGSFVFIRMTLPSASEVSPGLSSSCGILGLSDVTLSVTDATHLFRARFESC